MRNAAVPLGFFFKSRTPSAPTPVLRAQRRFTQEVRERENRGDHSHTTKSFPAPDILEKHIRFFIVPTRPEASAHIAPHKRPVSARRRASTTPKPVPTRLDEPGRSRKGAPPGEKAPPAKEVESFCLLPS